MTKYKAHAKINTDQPEHEQLISWEVDLVGVDFMRVNLVEGLFLAMTSTPFTSVWPPYGSLYKVQNFELHLKMHAARIKPKVS